MNPQLFNNTLITGSFLFETGSFCVVLELALALVSNIHSPASAYQVLGLKMCTPLLDLSQMFNLNMKLMKSANSLNYTPETIFPHIV